MLNAISNELLFWRQKEIREHFDKVQTILHDFIESAEEQKNVNMEFVENDTYIGDLAESAKEYVKETENSLIDQLIHSS